MWKKIIISIVVFTFLGVGIGIFVSNKKRSNINLNEEKENNPIKLEDISEELVDDDCTEEWEDYEEYIKGLEQASSMYQNEEIHYLVKAENNSIVVYYIDAEENNILYKETEISVNYLSEADVKSLKAGIDVYGVENLNKLLEDFE